MNNKGTIMDTTLNLLIEFGFAGTSMNHIIEASGVSTGGVYYHFKTKEDIITSLYLRIKKDIIEYVSLHIDFEASTRKFIEDYWYARLQWAMDHPRQKIFIEMYYHKPHHRISVSEEIAVRYNKLIERVNKAIEDEEIVTLDCAYFFADIDASINTILNYIKKHPEKDVDELLSFAFRKYWRSIVN